VTASRIAWLVVTPIWFAGATACAGGQRAPDAPERGPDVVIPQVTEEQAEKSENTPAPPTGARDPVASAETSYDDDSSGEEADPWGAYGSSGQRGGPDCDRAAICCFQMYQRMKDPSVMRVCGSLRSAPSSICSSVLSSFQQAAPSLGVQCP
jgi:hypothetical protein